MSLKIAELKKELKGLAEKIRNLRKETKKYQREHGGSLGSIGSMLKNIQWEYRHKHIAYCLLRGRLMNQIEKKNREHNEPDQKYIKMIMEKHSETICID